MKLPHTFFALRAALAAPLIQAIRQRTADTPPHALDVLHTQDSLSLNEKGTR